MASLKFENVSFGYSVFNVLSRSLKISVMQRISAGERAGIVKVNGLRDISFDASDGDRSGLIGRNGSGKSTVLRLAEGLARPTAGRIETKGRIYSLIEIGPGIKPEHCGNANIELHLHLLRANYEEVRRARVEIPEFTGLGEFMHLPVRIYSAGMRTRIVLALCTTIEGDILLMEKWLGAGDAQIVHRAEERLKRLVDRTKILVIASHSPDLVRSVCNKVICIDVVGVRLTGDAAEVTAAYPAEAGAQNDAADRLIAAE